MYPLLLQPHYTDYLWGGTKLKQEFGAEADTDKVAEAWVLSSHKDGQSVVLNGKMAGKKLTEVLGEWGQNEYFPILIKLIDAADKLSLQVHPDDAYALKNEGEYGKTEMWYVVDAAPDAKLIYGLKTAITQQMFESKIKDNTILEVCNAVPVKKGDVFYIKSGTLHAIGEGIVIAEVQQNSNTTYRVSDYGRLGADGKPRQLHIEKAAQVTELKPTAEPYGRLNEDKATDFGFERQLVSCKYFTVKLWDIKNPFYFESGEDFVGLLVLDGTIKVLYNDEEIEVQKGKCVLIPAGLRVHISGNAEVLYSLK